MKDTNRKLILTYLRMLLESSAKTRVDLKTIGKNIRRKAKATA